MRLGCSDGIWGVCVLKVDLNIRMNVGCFMEASACMYLMLQDGETALFEAAWLGCADIVKMLVEYGVVVDCKDKVVNCGQN